METSIPSPPEQHQTRTAGNMAHTIGVGEKGRHSSYTEQHQTEHSWHMIYQDLSEKLQLFSHRGDSLSLKKGLDSVGIQNLLPLMGEKKSGGTYFALCNRSMKVGKT